MNKYDVDAFFASIEHNQALLDQRDIATYTADKIEEGYGPASDDDSSELNFNN